MFSAFAQGVQGFRREFDGSWNLLVSIDLFQTYIDLRISVGF